MLETIRSPASVLSIASSIEPRRPAAKTATNETSASPIISAAAVAAVRPGLRIAFSRASRPGTPRRRSSGRPTTEASGVTSRGLSRVTPMKTAAAPTPTQASPGSSAPNSPSSISAEPERGQHDAGRRPQPRRSRGRREHRALAQAGDRRDPGRAQRREQRREHGQAGAEHEPDDRPSASRSRCRSPAGRSRAPRRAPRSPGAKPIPASTPSTEASRPITNASATTVARIWRRLAPSVRSIANSRVRWATVIEKVLKIRNAATNSETPAKISSAVFRKPMNSPTSSRWDSTFSAPGLRLDRVGQRGREVGGQLLGRRPLGGGDRDLVELALLAGDPLRLGQGEHAPASRRRTSRRRRGSRSRPACTR